MFIDLKQISFDANLNVFEKNDRKKMARKMKGHIKNSQETKTLCSVNVETGSHITITNEFTKKN